MIYGNKFLIEANTKDPIESMGFDKFHEMSQAIIACGGEIQKKYYKNFVAISSDMQDIDFGHIRVDVDYDNRVLSINFIKVSQDAYLLNGTEKYWNEIKMLMEKTVKKYIRIKKARFEGDSPIIRLDY